MPKTRKEDRRQLALELELRRPMPFPAPPNTKGLIEVLADLLLEALGQRTPAAEGIEGGGHELENQR